MGLGEVKKDNTMTIKAIALDLERTLITNVISRQARPGLYDFLRFCQDNFEKAVIFTGTSGETAQDLLLDLARKNLIPADFPERTKIIDWEGDYKDLRFITGFEPDEILIVDDFEEYILPEQKSQWIPIPRYDPAGENPWALTEAKRPSEDDPDNQLAIVKEILKQRLG